MTQRRREREREREREIGLIASVPSEEYPSSQAPGLKMPAGKLEILLVGAKGLENTDFFNNMDPYVIFTCRTQEQRSSVASRQGTTPEWNETLIFTLSEGVSEFSLKIMDSDGVSADDFVGEATILLEPLFFEGEIPPTSYNVIKDKEYRGEIKLGLRFIPEVPKYAGYAQRGFEEEDFGGWKASS